MKYSQMKDTLSWTCDFRQSQTSGKRGCVWKSQEELVPSLHALLPVRRPGVLFLCPGGPWEGGKRSHWDGQAKPGEAQENKEEEKKEVRFFPNKVEMMFVKVWQTAGLICLWACQWHPHISLSAFTHSFLPALTLSHLATSLILPLLHLPASPPSPLLSLWRLRRYEESHQHWHAEGTRFAPGDQIWNLNNWAIVRISLDQW